MGIKDNFTQAMKELTNPRPSDARKEVRDVASYMNDTADADVYKRQLRKKPQTE